MSHYPYAKPKLNNNPVAQWGDWLEYDSWSEEYVDLVPTRLIDNDAWSPPRLKDLEKAYAEGARLPPVRLSSRGGRYTIGDGNHRVELSKIHGLTHVPAILVRTHNEPPPGQPPTELAQETSGRELGKLLSVLRRKEPLLAQYAWKSVSRDGKAWLIQVGVEVGQRFVDGMVAVKKSGGGYAVLAKWDDDKSPQRFQARSHEDIAEAVWGWIEKRESGAAKMAREILRIAHDLLADGLSEKTVADLASESRRLRAVPFRQGMKEPVGVVGGKKVCAVDGDEVKVKHTMDFVEGGNGLVYDFIPRGEIWVDARMEPQDWPHIAFHEAVESLLMEERGLGYDEAHAQANALEVGEIRDMASAEILRVARDLVSSDAEKEVERLLKALLRGTTWQGKVFSVGGYNRDQLLGLDPKDLDLVVELPSERGKEMPEGAKKFTHFVYQQFPQSVHRPFQTGAAYPIWQLVFEDDIELGGETYRTKGAAIDVADTMKEAFPDPESRQRQVQWGTLQDDVERRDFTVNSLLKDMSSGELVDLTGVSVSDIKKGVLRGNPMVSMDEIFRNDPLRMIRLVRFQAKYGWQVPLSVLKSVKRNADRISIVSAERIMGELEKVMKMGKLAQAVKMMKATGLLPYVMPEIDALRGVKQSPEFHAEGDVFRHTMNVLKNAPATVEGQLAALMHDIGKPSTQEILGEEIHFHGHEDVGAEMAEAMLRRLKFDNETTKQVVTMVRNHMRPHSLSDASEKALRKFVRDLGEEMADAVLALAKADEEGSSGSGATRGEVEKLKERLQKVKESPVKVQRKPVLSGNEIMQELDIKPEDRKRLPEIGKAQKFLLEVADEYAGDGKELTKADAVIELRKRFKPAE